MKNRVFYLDIIRILACIMIITIHAPIPNTGLDSYVLSSVSMLAAPGIGLFVMVSGALLLPINIPTKQFLQRRFKKIVGPLIFWTLESMIIYVPRDTILSPHILSQLLSIPIQAQFSPILWFMYMLAGLYLLAPILSAWLRYATKRECRFYLCLWFITLCYPLVRTFLIINESYSGIFYYFSGYAGYFLLGYYFKMYVKSESIWKSFLLLLIPISFAILLKIQRIQVPFYDMFWLLSVFTVMMCAAWFLLAKRIKITYDKTIGWHKIVALVSNCCFGIYLIHIFIMRSIIWKWAWLYDLGTIQILIVTLLTFIGSFVVTWLISCLPGAEYIVGFRQKI